MGFLAAGAVLVANLLGLLGGWRDRHQQAEDRTQRASALESEERYRNIRWAAEQLGSGNVRLMAAGSATLQALGGLRDLSAAQEEIIEALLATAALKDDAYTGDTEYVVEPDGEDSPREMSDAAAE